MENNIQVMDEGQKTKEIMTAKEYRSIFWRSFTIQCSWSFDKMMAYGYMYAIQKPLRKIYPDDNDFYAALKRHTETFNITPHVSPFIMTLGVAMEEENAKAESFDTDSINNVKVGLMGPLSGIGDSFFWGTFRVIAAGIGIGLAQQGNILGALIYFLLYTSIHFLTKILAGKYGYKLGTSFLENASENHMMEKLSYGASILGDDSNRCDGGHDGISADYTEFSIIRYGNYPAIHFRPDFPWLAAVGSHLPLRMAL